MQIRLEDIFKTSWKTKSVTLKTSSKRLEDVLENKKCLLGGACNFIKKETLVQVFSCEFCEISKNTFLYRTLLVATSAYNPLGGV